jgi:hypothetical protein
MLIPVRGLGSAGVLTDPSAFDLPAVAWTRARNVSFRDKQIVRSPGFRTFQEPLSATQPVFAYAIASLTGGFDNVIVADRGGKLWSYQVGAETDISHASWTEFVSDEPWTACTLGGIHYINRPDQVPVKITGPTTAAATMSSWLSTWRCRALRSYRGALWGLGMTESGVEQPNRIRWSTFATYGSEPSSFASGDPTKTSGATFFADLTGPVVDGLRLRRNFYVYGTREVTEVRYVGGNAIWAFDTLWDDLGVLGPNCVASVRGQHVVFGVDDLVVHNGSERTSIAEGKVRRKIYNSINWQRLGASFVVHDMARSEVLFAYNSTSDDAHWAWATYANEAAVWNYASDTWSFRDLPNVGTAATANAASGQTWDDRETAWDDSEGAWQSVEDNASRSVILPANPGENQELPKLLAIDGLGPTNTLALPIDTEFTPECLIERDKLDFDEIQAELRGYKRMKTIFPQVRDDDGLLEVSVGTAQTPQGATEWGPWRSVASHKVDYMKGGRFLGVRYRYPGDGGGVFTLSGHDLMIDQIGTR